MPVAEIIAIGTELLLGEIQDTNTRYLARNLRDFGVDIYRTMMVGDNADRIAQSIREAAHRSQIIITTGGLGPTVDDPTRQAVAQAMDVETVFIPELWEQIQNRFQRYGRQATENNKRQAYIPANAVPVENPVGTAPAFIVEKAGFVIISLPGVPREMEYLTQHTILPYLKERFDLRGTIKARVLHASGVGESQVDEWIGDLETLHNPTVGLLAHPGQVDVRVTAKADSAEEANALIDAMATEVRKRLGDAIFGVDEDTLVKVVLNQLSAQNLSLSVLECGLEGEMVQRLLPAGLPAGCFLVESQPLEEAVLRERTLQLRGQLQTDISLGASLAPGGEKQTLTIILAYPQGVLNATRTYGGPPPMAVPWGVNLALDFIRRNIR